MKDWRRAPLSPRERALCDYAEKLTHDQTGVSRDDLDVLRRHGLADRDLLDLVQIVSYFNYINRVAHGLGVETESRQQDADGGHAPAGE